MRLAPHRGATVRALTLIALALLAAGCKDASARPEGPTTGAPPTAAPAASVSSTPTPAPSPAVRVKRPAFDGPAAFKLLEKQCAFGPRPVGSEAHRRTRDFLVEEMRKYADRLDTQDFSYRGMPLTNVIGVFNPEAKKQVLLCTHWDTRPHADQEIDPNKQRQPIVGANDGASGTAILLQLARMLHEQKPEVGVLLVLLDGEDYGDFAKDEGVFLGSKYFAKNHKGYDPAYGILIDMVGDRDLDIYREKSSERYATDINQKVFGVARDLDYGKYLIDDLKTDVLDDHIPLNRAGIPTIDLIDFDYGPWHTLDDTPDKCSADSLAIVGNTLAEVVYREKP